MSGKLDQISGNVKEKAGELLDDPKLQAEGVIQQGTGIAQDADSRGASLNALRSRDRSYAR